MAGNIRLVKDNSFALLPATIIGVVFSRAAL